MLEEVEENSARTGEKKLRVIAGVWALLVRVAVGDVALLSSILQSYSCPPLVPSILSLLSLRVLRFLLHKSRLNPCDRKMSEKKSGILQLPPELLHSIIEPLDAGEIRALWMTGSKNLMMKLGSVNGATYWRQTEVGVKSFSWPFLISQFSGLTYISIHESTTISSFTAKPHHIASLPQSVTFLNLNISGCFLAFQKVVWDQPSIFERLVSLTLGDKPVLPSMPPLELAWPKNVEFLNIRSATSKLALTWSGVPSKVKFLQASFEKPLHEPGKRLPSSLTDLRLSLHSLGRSFFDMLPKGLLHLEISHNKDYNSVWTWDNLPPLLETLVCPVAPNTLVKIAQLPKTLTVLDLPEVKPLYWEDSNANCFPPHLKSLGSFLPSKVGFDPRVTAEMLPRTLTTLGTSVVDAAVIPKLPRSLTELTVSRMHDYWWHLHPEKNLNSSEIKSIHSALASMQLKELTLKHRFEVFERPLPSSLTKIHLAQTIPPVSLLRYLPATLHELKTQFAFEQIDAQKLFKLLPPQLRIFMSGYDRWMHTGPETGWAIHDAPEEKIMPIGTQTAQFLPKNLKSLSLASISLYDASWFSNLPQSIQHINVILHESHTLNFRNVRWPSQLSSLCLTFHAPPEADFVSDILTAIPPSITQFTVHLVGNKNYKAQKLSETAFTSLPPQIRSIRIPNCPIPSPDVVLSSIPASLTTFLLDGNEPGWFSAHRRGTDVKKAPPPSSHSNSNKKRNRHG